MRNALSKVMLASLVPCVTYARELRDRWQGEEYNGAAVAIAAGGIAVSLILASICVASLVSAVNRQRPLRDRLTGWLTS